MTEALAISMIIFPCFGAVITYINHNKNKNAIIIMIIIIMSSK